MKKPAFIIGTPRSGTTLAARILGMHSRLFMPGETHYFPDIYAKRDAIGSLNEAGARDILLKKLLTIYERYNEPDDQKRVNQVFSDEKFLGQLKAATHSYQDLFETFMDIQAKSQGKLRWGNNVPKDIFFTDDIHEMFPGAQFILCVRDPRDFLASYKGKWKITADSQSDRVRKLYHPVVTSLLWKASMKLIPALEKKLGTENLYVLQYEKLVNEPEKVVRELCGYLGEVYEPQMCAVEYSDSSSGQKYQGIGVQSVGRWETVLTPEEIWLGQFIAGQEMDNLGYGKIKTRTRLYKIFWLLLMAPVALIRGLRANRENTGPVIPYLIRRIRSLLG